MYFCVFIHLYKIEHGEKQERMYIRLLLMIDTIEMGVRDWRIEGKEKCKRRRVGEGKKEGREEEREEEEGGEVGIGGGEKNKEGEGRRGEGWQ